MALANAFDARIEDPPAPQYRFYCNKELELVGIRDPRREDGIPSDLIEEALELDCLTSGQRDFWPVWLRETEEWRKANWRQAYDTARRFVQSNLTLELPRNNLLRIGELFRLRIHSRNRANRLTKILHSGTIDVYPVPYS